MVDVMVGIAMVTVYNQWTDAGLIHTSVNQLENKHRLDLDMF